MVPATPPNTIGRQLVQNLERSIKVVKRTSLAVVAKSPSPTKAYFLTKESNTTGFIVSEIEEKVGKMDAEFQQLKEFMSATEKNSATVKEELEIAKRRGK